MVCQAYPEVKKYFYRDIRTNHGTIVPTKADKEIRKVHLYILTRGGIYLYGVMITCLPLVIVI
jgi:hypothetical protein